MITAMNGKIVRMVAGFAGALLLAAVMTNPERAAAAEVVPAAVPTSGPVSATVLTNAALQKVVVPVSRFVTEPTYGRDPFFPASKRRIEPEPTIAEPEPDPEPKPKPNKMANITDPGKIIARTESDDGRTSFLSIKGILATARSRNVTLHTTVRSYLFRTGDEILLRVPDGKLRVRCLEIRGNSALFQLEGRKEPVELFLSNGLNR
jgi:hypothetical protein